ncbi:MAG: lysophospholipid acyltransferase family protein [Chitinophagaceae bacterium]|nr:lysophospholipid acyltransferase family protein [Oligoflexus sp.]
MSVTWKKSFILRLSTFLCVLFHKSYRYRFYNTENLKQAELFHPKKAFVIASWHQNCFAGILAHAGQGIALLVSRSLDGEIVSRLANSIGLTAIRGSSRKGGREALAILVERTHDGLRSAITIDGPKGPIFEIKRGVFCISAETGAPILPMVAVGARYWTLHKSWDKFRIPKPFSKVAVLYGKPFVVTNAEILDRYEELQSRLANELHTLEIQAVNMGLTAHPPTDRSKVERDRRNRSASTAIAS